MIFTSDNGFMHGEHRVKTGKIVPYEESIRVPLLIRGPGFRGGKTVRDMSINADLAPTIVEATGAQAGVRMDGMPLQGLAAQPGRQRGRELSIEGGGFTGVRTQRYIYLQYTSGANINFSEMYDLEADPFELQNVASNPAYAAVRARLDARLAGVRGCSGDSCRLAPAGEDQAQGSQSVSAAARDARSGPGSRTPTQPASCWPSSSSTATRVGNDRKRPFQRKLPYRKLKRKRISKARVLVTLLDGRQVTIYKNVRACR